MRFIHLLVIGFLVLMMGCVAPQAVPEEPASESASEAQGPSPIEEEPRTIPSEPTPPTASEPAGAGEVEQGAEKVQETLLPGFAKLTLADPDNPIEIISWGIEQGSSGSAKLMNVTFIVRNTGREPFTGKVLFEAWEENIFLEKTWDIGAIIPPGQSYTFTEYVDVTLDAPKQQKQMRAVLIVTKGLAVSGEDHKFFVPLKR